MGFIDIEHKYFHRLRLRSKFKKFSKIMFPTTKLQFAFDLYLKINMMNGSICD